MGNSTKNLNETNSSSDLKNIITNLCTIKQSVHIVPPHKQNERFYLGSISLGTTNNAFPQTWSNCMLIFTSSNGSYNLNLKLIFDASTIVETKLNCDICFIKDLLTSDLFAFLFYTFGDIVTTQVFLKRLPLPNFHSLVGCLLKKTFNVLLDIELIDNKDVENDRVEGENNLDFYTAIKQINRNLIQADNSVQPQLLNTTLLPYQQNAARWMISREEYLESEDILHPLFTKITLKMGTTIYYNKYSGFVSNKKPTVKCLKTGGILADDTGLGKTVEVLACILLSPKPDTFEALKSNSSLTLLSKSNKRKLHANEGLSSNRKNKRVKLFHNTANLSKRGSQPYNFSKTPKLNGGNVTSSKQMENNVVYCVCGSNKMTPDAIQCVRCLNYRHASCVNYKKEHGEYICPVCWLQQELIESKATLIVCPAFLCAQWYEEITKNVMFDIRVYVYEGFRTTPIYPTELADYDVVITTYTTLQAEYYLSQSSIVPSLRHIRRYATHGSPLCCIKWWRLCLDEAHIIAASGTKVSTMAKRLNAQYRWAITSTPVIKNISGLLGLIEYIQYEPYYEKDTWKHLIYLPYIHGNPKPMLDLLSKIMWRSSKEDVIDEMQLPPLTVKEYLLEFSSVENFVYRKEHTISATQFLEIIRTLNLSGQSAVWSLEKFQFNEVMGPLLIIRQACNNANMIVGQHLVTCNQVTSMKKLLDALIAKNLQNCEKNLQALICVLNGLAGICLLSNSPDSAAVEYRKVIALSSRFNSKDKSFQEPSIDKLQLIHALHNLATLLNTWSSDNPIAEDNALGERCQKVQEEYIEKHANQCLIAYKESEMYTESVMKLKDKFILQPKEWYSRIISWISINGLLKDLACHVSSASCIRKIDNIFGFTDEHNVYKLVSTWEDEIITLRQHSYDLLSMVYHFGNGRLNICSDLVEAATLCHLHTRNSVVTCYKKCLICKISDRLCTYEAKLFENTHDIEKEHHLINKDSGKLHWIEYVLRIILGLAKGRCSDSDAINDGELFFSYLDSLKKEFKAKCKLWLTLKQQINAVDETNMCKIRMYFKVPQQCTDEHAVNSTSPHKIKFFDCIAPNELTSKEAFLREEEVKIRAEFEKNFGTLRYLETLCQKDNSGHNPDPCPICQNELKDHWSILPCGHSYCLDCIDSLINRAFERVRLNVSCSVCRQTCRKLDISYIRAINQLASPTDGIIINGDYSTKIDAIIKLIVTLKNDEDGVKVLVCSTWIDVLAIINTALSVNCIQSEIVYTHTFRTCLSNFKHPEKNVMVLLLPLNLISKGLNLTEASHIIFVEPLFNPADEAQVIAKLHRMGQTKPVIVHKFIIKNTIEDNMHKIISANTKLWCSSELTLSHIKDLFVLNEESESTQ